MTIGRLRTVALLGCLIAFQAVSQLEPPAASAAPQAKLEGMPYLQARKVILSYGWKSFPGACSGPDVNRRTCAMYPEVGHCTGIGVGLCQMKFTRRNRCLMVTTIGGAPQAHEGDTVIQEILFRRGQCPRVTT